MKTSKSFASYLVLLLLTACMVIGLASCDQITIVLPNGTTAEAETTTEPVADSATTPGDKLENTTPEDVKPEDVKPEDVKPEDSKPEDIKPEDSTPEDVKPEDSKPEDIKPEDSTPEETKPTEPEETKPGDDPDVKPDDGCQHQFVDGVCSICGFDKSNLYYYNLIESLVTGDRFSLTIKDLVIDVETNDTDPSGMQKVTSVDLAQLELFYENGEVGGAAHGTVEVTFFSSVKFTAELSALISDGYLYLVLSATGDETQEMMGKYSVEEMLNDMIGSANASVVQESLPALVDAVLPMVKSLAEDNSASINNVLEDVLNIFFTFEGQKDGSVVVTLSESKLLALNEALATKLIAEVIDIYFGEGTFNGIVDLAYEILDLKLSEIPAYLKDKGVDYDDLIADLQDVLTTVGAPEDTDINEMLTNSEMSDSIIGNLIGDSIGIDEGSYKAYIEENIVSFLRENTFYNLFGLTEDEQSIGDDIIAQACDYLSLTITTNAIGEFTAINANVTKAPFGGSSMSNEQETDTAYPNEDGEILYPDEDYVQTYASTTITYSNYATFSLEILANGTIDVTWGDIVDTIEGLLVSPPEEIKGENGLNADSKLYEGATVFFQGEEYACDYYDVWVSEMDFDTVLSTVIYPDCNGWFDYSLTVPEKEYDYRVYFFTDYDYSGSPVIFFIMNLATKDLVKVEQVSGGFNVTYENGKIKYIVMAISENDPMIIITAKLFPLMFEEIEVYEYTAWIDFYYNPSTGEYAYESQHEWEYTYDVWGETCEDGCTVTQTCKNCKSSDSWTSYYHHDDNERVTIDLNQYGMCGGYIEESKCKACNTATYSHINDYCCWEWQYDTADGYSVFKCTECNAIKNYKYTTTQAEKNCQYTVTEGYIYIVDGKEVYHYEKSYTYTDHDYEYSYDKFAGETCKDGYRVIEICTNCGETHEWEEYGHSTINYEKDLGDLGMCGGYITETKCEVCGIVEDSYIEDWACCWKWQEDDADGYSVYQCSICNAIKKSKYAKQNADGCQYTVNEEYIYILDSKEVYHHTNSYTNTDHNWEYSYKPFGETCDDGYMVIQVCTNCGEAYEWEGYGHSYDKYEIDLGEFGMCGGYIQESSCQICGTVTYIYANDYDCNWEWKYDDSNGYSVYQCTNCNAVKKTKSFATEKDENCNYTETDSYIYIVGGKEVYHGEAVETYTDHNRDYKYELQGETCLDGVLHIGYCLDCGYVDEVNEMINYHPECETSEGGIDLRKTYGICGGCIRSSRCCVCEATFTELDEFWNCNFECIYETDIESVYQCTECGVVETYTFDWEKLIHTLTLDGKEIFSEILR